MTTSLGPKGYVNIQTTEHGPADTLRLIRFRGRSDTGDIENAQFRAGEDLIAVVDVTNGVNATSYYSATAKTGAIVQTLTDTGVGLDQSGNTFVAITKHP